MVSGGCSRLLSCLSASLSVCLLSVYSLFLLCLGTGLGASCSCEFVYLDVRLSLSVSLSLFHPSSPSFSAPLHLFPPLPPFLPPSLSLSFPSSLPHPPPPLISLSISFGRSVGLRRPMREEKVAVRGRWRPLAFVLALSSSALWFSPCSSCSASPFVRVLFFSWCSILSISLAFSAFSFALLSSRSFIHLHRHLLNLLSPPSSVCS